MAATRPASPITSGIAPEFERINARLTGFHREVIAPEFERINARLDAHDARFDEMLGHFDAIYHRFDRLEDEYQALKAGVARMEKQMAEMMEKFEEAAKPGKFHELRVKAKNGRVSHRPGYYESNAKITTTAASTRVRWTI